jgi:hypothetical protein
MSLILPRSSSANEANRLAHLGKSPANKGKKMSDEERAALSARMKAYYAAKKRQDNS